MLRRQLLAGCIVTTLMGAAHAAVFSVGHVNAIGTAGKLRFANVLADDLGGWEYGRGHYVVRESGFYYIAFHGLSRLNTSLTLGVFRNDEELLAGYGSDSYSTASSSGLMPLRLGDRISLRAIKGIPYESNDSRRNYFGLSGFRIGNDDGGPFLPPPPAPAVTAGLAPSPIGPPGTFSSPVTQPEVVGPLSSRFAVPASAGVALTEVADAFRPLTVDLGGPI